MTVPQPNRSPPNKLLNVQKRAYELYRYTMLAACSEKMVPKRQRWCNGAPLVQAARSICQCINRANRIRTDGPCAAKRREMQEMAAGWADNLLTEIHLVYYSHHFRPRRLQLWIERVEEVLRLLDAWMKSKI